MVLRRQFLERPALIEAAEATLEGLFHRGDRAPPLLLCPPPAEGGGMDAPPLAEIAWACARAGHASLRFQHRGVGASQGTIDPSRRLEDAQAAWRHLMETARGPRVAVAGLGTGCETALALVRAHPEIERAVLVAPEAAPALDVSARLLLLLPEQPEARWRGEAAAALESQGGRLEVIAGADARFGAGLPLLGRLAVGWIGRD